MRPFWKDLLYGFMVGMVLPGAIVHLAAAYFLPTSAVQTVAVVTQPEETAPKSESEEQETKMTMKLRTPDGNVEEQDMDSYLVCVLLKEMPAYFETEALKAQAVVARTYALKASVTGGKHGDGSVCTRPECCQGYLTEAEYRSAGGKAEAVDKIRSAVDATSGSVLLYGGIPIEATYFSCSGGRTEDAAAVWGTDFPYLRAVDSPGEEEASHYCDTQVFQAAEFADALGIASEKPLKEWFGTATYTAGGGIAEMTIGGKKFTGTELRQLLGLRSTDIVMETDGETVTVTTMGYGHRVGMSQYGADAMAASGSNYEEILAHYYQGAVLSDDYVLE